MSDLVRSRPARPEALGREESDPVSSLVVGVLSDTHGRLYPRVHELLQGVDHLIHAGDVGSEDVLRELRAIAPLTVVRGNCDYANWAAALPSSAEVELAGVRFSVTHIARTGRTAGARLPAGPDTSGLRAPEVVVTGHTHLAALEWREGVLHLNPGSAGPRRFGRPRTLARVEILGARRGIPQVSAQVLVVED